MESSYIGAYWGSRREAAQQCGERLARCIAALAGVDPVLGSWFRRGARKAAARTPVDVDAMALGELLEHGRNRRDFGGEILEELGFTVGLWNRARPAVGLSATVGTYSTSPGILNSFVLELPPLADGSSCLYQPKAAGVIFEAIVQAWNPEWATWTTHGWREAQAAAPREPVVGWLTYLHGSALQHTPHAALRPVDGGVLIQATPEFNDADEVAILAVREDLVQSAALHPIP